VKTGKKIEYGSKCRSGSRNYKNCGSVSRDSKNPEPMRIPIRNPALHSSAAERTVNKRIGERIDAGTDINQLDW